MIEIKEPMFYEDETYFRVSNQYNELLYWEGIEHYEGELYEYASSTLEDEYQQRLSISQMEG